MKTTYLLIILYSITTISLFAAQPPIEKRVNDLEATIVRQGAELHELTQISAMQEIEFERIRQAYRNKLQNAELKEIAQFKNKK